ncbi:MAG: thioredoxin [Clostridia bacterium]|nr:thioredoxin [Clostridia bacterium]
MKFQVLNKANFDEIVSSGKTVLVDFYADWCGPCRMLKPILEDVAKEREDIIVGKVNVDEEDYLASRYGVFSIPTLIVFKNGEIVNQASGARPKAQVLALVDG